MGGNVADYLAFADTPFTLDVAADLDRNLGPRTLPGDTIVDQTSILSFMAKANTSGSRLKVSINGNTVISSLGLGSTDNNRCIQEVCGPNILRNGGNNVIKFEVTSGSCAIGDVVLWFQNRT